MPCDCVRLFPDGVLAPGVSGCACVPVAVTVCLMSSYAAQSGSFLFVISLGAACLRASGRVAEADAGASRAAQMHSGDAWLPCTGFCETVCDLAYVCGWLLIPGSIGELVLSVSTVGLDGARLGLDPLSRSLLQLQG